MIKTSRIIVCLLFSLSAAAQDQIPLKDFLMGKFDYRASSDFARVEEEHSSKPVYLHGVAYKAFVEMFEAAKKDSIHLKIVSGTRNFSEQKAIWDRKWNNLKDLEASEKLISILEFSAMPGTSRHHWGTEVDLNNLENSYFEEGRGKAEYEWLLKHAARFGFYQVYTSQNSGRTGYQEEKWHWSYLPLAAQYLEDYNLLVTYAQICNFHGSELASKHAIIANYVNGIPQEYRSLSFIQKHSQRLAQEKSPAAE